jgi:hypothetical protein
MYHYCWVMTNLFLKRVWIDIDDCVSVKVWFNNFYFLKRSFKVLNYTHCTRIDRIAKETGNELLRIRHLGILGLLGGALLGITYWLTRTFYITAWRFQFFLPSIYRLFTATYHKKKPPPLRAVATMKNGFRFFPFFLLFLGFIIFYLVFF